MVYCTYNMLNMFRTLLCPSSGARDYMFVITAYGVQCLVAGCRRSSRTHSLPLCTWPPTTSNQALHTVGGNNTHIVSSSWWWAYKCPKHVERIRSAINYSVTSSWVFLYACATMHGQTHIKFVRYNLERHQYFSWNVIPYKQSIALASEYDLF